MTNSSVKNTDGAVRVVISSEGKVIAAAVFGLIALTVYKSANRIGRAELSFEAGDSPKSNVPESADETFAPGKNITVSIGYGDHQDLIFKGTVTAHRVLIDENDSVLLVECSDYAYPSTLGRKNQVFEKSTDSDAITKILKEYSALSATVDATHSKHNELVQYYCSDWDFVLARADANGLLVITEGKDIKVQKPKVSASPILKITYGMDLIAFDGELQTIDQEAGLDAVAWDASTQKLLKATGSAPSLNKQGNLSPAKLAQGNKWSLQNDLCTDEASLKSWADGQLLKTGLARIQGTCKFIGQASVVVGCVIELDGLGKRFNGNVYVGSVKHEFVDGFWSTTVGIGISAENITEKKDTVSPPASGFLPGIQGLHIGKVIKIDEDPTGEDKIQVEVPIWNGSINTVWARCSNFWASSDYGSFFIPDVGDEVVLGFFNNDPCHAVILGSMYSSKQAPPYSLKSDNNTRAIVTKSKMKIVFDEEKKRVSIETPAQNTLVLDDDAKSIKITDQHKNKIEMTANGILIESAKEITLKAKTNISMDAGVTLEMKAKSKLAAEALTIEANAKTSLTLKGTATAELSASGQTIVKGAIVMIN